VADSTSINLYTFVHAAINISKYTTKIITDEFNFPSDHYILQGIISQLAAKYEITVIKSRDGITIADEDLISEVDDNTALVVLSHSAFKSAYLYDMEKITQAVQKKGALILWDLSHSAGIADVKLNKCHVDFAIGCTYKYLNGGPGSPAFMFAREDLHDKLTSPIWGWFGDEHPFNFDLNFKPAKGMNRFFVGTPPILSLAAVDSGIDLVLKAGIGNIRKKSIDQTEYLIYLFNQKLKPLGFSLGSPVSSNRRGSHISIRHPEARRIIQAMTDENNETIVIPDFREPDNIRLGISPLYNTFTEIWKAIEIIENIAVHKRYLNYNPQIRGVT
jgi:kynureninase